MRLLRLIIIGISAVLVAMGTVVNIADIVRWIANMPREGSTWSEVAEANEDRWRWP